MKAFVETLTTPKNKPLSENSKSLYVSNMKTIMGRMKQNNNLDFLVTNVQGLLKYLDDIDDSESGEKKYRARMKSRSAYTTIVVFLPLAKTNDPNDRVVVKDQYNQWLQSHPASAWKDKRLWDDMGGSGTNNAR